MLGLVLFVDPQKNRAGNDMMSPSKTKHPAKPDKNLQQRLYILLHGHSSGQFHNPFYHLA